MVTKYPAAIDTVFTLKPLLDGQPITGGSVEQLRVAIIAIEDELGVRPSGLYATVRARLDAIENIVGNLRIIELEGDLGGTLETPKMIGIQGRPVSDVEPTNGQTLIWNGIAWIPGAIPADITFAGDLTGTTSTQTVVGINGTPVTTTDGANDGDVLTLQKSPVSPDTFFSPQAMATDGTYVWVGNNRDKSIDKVNISNKQTEHFNLTAFLPGGATSWPRRVVYNGDLSPYLFVAGMDADRVLILEKLTGEVIGIGDTNGMRARSCAIDNLGNVWVSTKYGDTTVQRFVIADLISNYPTPVLAASSVGVATDPEEIAFDGTNIWAVGSFGDVDRIDPTGSGTNTGTNRVSVRWLSDVVPAFGAIWVLNQGNPTQVEKFDPNTFPSGYVDSVEITDAGYLRTMRASNGLLWVPDTDNGTSPKLYKVGVNPLQILAEIDPPSDELSYFEVAPDPLQNKIYIAVWDATDLSHIGFRTFNTASDTFTDTFTKLNVSGVTQLHYAPGSGTPNTIIFRPGVPSVAPAYETWPEVIDAVATLPGVPVTILFDDNNASCIIPAGTWDIGPLTTFAGSPNAGDANTTTIFLANGSHINSPIAYFDVAMRIESDSPVITSVPNSFRIELTNSFFESDSNNRSTIYNISQRLYVFLYHGSTIHHGNGPEQDQMMQSTNDFTFYMFDGAEVEQGAIVTTGNIQFVNLSNSSLPSTGQIGSVVEVAISPQTPLDPFGRLSYGPTFSRPNVAGQNPGYRFFDTTLNTLVVWDGTTWITLGGGDLAGDVTGPIGSNVVEQITGSGGNVNILAAQQTSTAIAQYQPFSEQHTFVATGGFDVIYNNYSIPASTGVQVDVVVTAIDSSSSNFASWKLAYGALRTGGGSPVAVGTVPSPTGVAPDRSTAGAAGWIATIILSGSSVFVKGQATSGIRWGISFQVMPVTP